MERTLLFFSLVLATLGLAGGSVIHRPKTETPWIDKLPERERPFWWLAIVLAAMVFLVTLPGKPPFAPGASFGYGYLPGALLFLVAARLRRRTDDGVPYTFLFAGVMAVSFVMAFVIGAEQDALLGAALGAGVSALILSTGAGTGPDLAAWNRSLKVGAGFATLVALTAALGLLRDKVDSPANPVASPGLWSACGVALCAVVGLGAVIAAFLESKDSLPGVFSRLGALLWEEDSPGRAAALVLAIVVSLAASVFIGLALLGEPSFTVLFALGLLSGLLALGLSRDSSSESKSSGFAAPLSTLVLLAAFMAAFSVLQGFGAAVLLAGAGLPLLFAPANHSQNAIRAWIFGLGLVTYRLFSSRYAPQLRGSELTESYALFGLALGALLPTLPVIVSRDGAQSSLARLLAGGIIGIAAPSAVVLFYGPKAGISLLVGLAFCSALRGRTLSSLWALVMGLSLTQLTPHLLPLADLTRYERLRLLLTIAVVLAVILVAADLVGRIRSKK